MTKIKRTEEHGLLQMIIWMILPPLCSSIPLQMVICKEDGSPEDQNQGDGGAGIVANDHPDDPASSLPLQVVICKEDRSPNLQIKGTEEHGLLQMIIWMECSPPFRCNWSFAKKTVLQITNIFLVRWG